MKKIFEQPELMVVRMTNNIIATSTLNYVGEGIGLKADGADRFRDFEDYSY